MCCLLFAVAAVTPLQQAADFLSGMGLGMVADQLKELKLGELLDTPPPGLDEAVAIAKVVQFVNSQVGLDFGSSYLHPYLCFPHLNISLFFASLQPRVVFSSSPETRFVVS